MSRPSVAPPHLTAAIYARKSTEQGGVADEAKSVTRQVEHATAYATRKGWTVDPAHVYIDDGISGAEFVKRPGFLRLMNALKPRPSFQVVVTMEQSRLGRSLEEVPVALKRITDAGVRIYCYLTDSEVKRDTLLDRYLVSTMAMVDEMHRQQDQQRARDVGRGKARAGHVAGGKVYGYTNVRREGHVVRVIDPTQAAVVTRVFTEIAQGRGYARIARGLNAEGVPGPRPGRGWAKTCLWEMAFRDLYRGRSIYGKTRWVDRGGTKVKEAVPADDWIDVKVPECRIIPETLWTAAHARLARTRQTYTGGVGNHRETGARPDPALESRHLFGGLVRCGTCGGAMHAIKRTSRRGTPRVYYVCNGWRVDGTCTNGWSLPLPDLDAAMLAVLDEEVLTTTLLEDVLAQAVAEAAAQYATLDAQCQRLERDMKRVDRILDNFVSAIADGKPPARLMEKMREQEQHRATLAAQLQNVEARRRSTRPTVTPALKAMVRAVLAEWATLLRGEPSEARPILRRLLPGRLTLTPRETPEGRCYEITGTVTVDPLLEGAVAELVPPG